MAQLVVKMLKRRESLRQEAYTTLVSSPHTNIYVIQIYVVCHRIYVIQCLIQMMIMIVKMEMMTTPMLWPPSPSNMIML